MDEDTLTQVRGEVIESTITLETMINTVICVHYLGKISKSFYYEVLYDEYFNLGIKLHILEKIIQRLDKEDLKHIHNLRRLITIRNYFAHTDTQFLEPGEIGEDGMIGLVPDPKRLDKYVDYDKLYDEFNSLQRVELKYLQDLVAEVAPH